MKEFKEMLLKRKHNLLEILNHRNANIKELHASSLKDDGDVVSAQIQGELDALIIEKYTIELEEIEVSLQKIIDKTYGVCEMCDEMISKKRLTLKPHARFCITCREIYEKEIYEKQLLQEQKNNADM